MLGERGILPSCFLRCFLLGSFSGDSVSGENDGVHAVFLSQVERLFSARQEQVVESSLLEECEFDVVAS